MYLVSSASQATKNRTALHYWYPYPASFYLAPPMTSSDTVNENLRSRIIEGLLRCQVLDQLPSSAIKQEQYVSEMLHSRCSTGYSRENKIVLCSVCRPLLLQLLSRLRCLTDEQLTVGQPQVVKSVGKSWCIIVMYNISVRLSFLSSGSSTRSAGAIN